MHTRSVSLAALTAISMALGAVAHAAPRVLLMTDDAELPAALDVALSARRADVVVEPDPPGEQPLDRAAVAARVARADGADAGVWIEPGEVWVVSGDGRTVRHAPMPLVPSPRALAAIAASLLDELLAAQDDGPAYGIAPPPPPAPAVLAPPPVIVGPAPILLAPAPALVARDAPARPADDPRAPGRILLEVGPAVGTALYGADAALRVEVGRGVRLGLAGGVYHLFGDLGDRFNGGNTMVDGAVELSYAARGRLHFVGGVAGGVARDVTDELTDGLLAVRVGGAYETGGTAITLAIEPTVFLSPSGDPPAAALFANLHIGFHLR